MGLGLLAFLTTTQFFLCRTLKYPALTYPGNDEAASDWPLLFSSLLHCKETEWHQYSSLVTTLPVGMWVLDISENSK